MKKRVVYYDVLNILATFGVVLLHNNGIAHNFSNSLAWYQALLVEVVFYWPVPVFFMLSGANLMGYRERYTTKEFLKKRFVRTVIPFVAWTLISAVHLKVDPFNIGFKEFFVRCFNTSIENTYWFFIPLFAIYLAMPVLSLLKDNRRILWYMAGGAFVLSSLLPPIFGYMGMSWNHSLKFLTAGEYLIFAILGYLLSTENFNLKQRIWIYVLGFAGVVIRYGGTVYLCLRDDAMNRTFFSYLHYYSVFLAAAVFVLFRYSKTVEKLAHSEKTVKALKILSGCSFGVYLSHRLISRELAGFVNTQCWQWRLLMPFVIYVIAVTLTFIIKKIPIIKKIVP